MQQIFHRLYRSLVTLLLTFVSLFVQAQETLSSDSLVAADLRARGIHTTDGNDVRLLKSGHDKFVDLFEEVQKAKHFIHLEYFNFRNDTITEHLIRLLAEKAREGVEVRAMYDAFGNSSNNRPLKHHKHDSIEALGIRLVRFDPIRFPYINHAIPRDHRKIVVIDGRVGYTGGMNVANYYITGIEGIGPWRDMHMHIEGPAVNDLHNIFCRMWAGQTGEILVGPKYFPAHSGHEGTIRVAIVDREAGYTPSAIRDLFVSMLNSARHHVRIITPYFVPTHRVRQALKDAVDRGIHVEIMLSAKGDIPMMPDITHYIGNNLAKRGAQVYLYTGGFHHSKLMIIDDRFCTIGSANMDSRSLRCDYEVNAVIFAQKTVDELNAMFEADLAQSYPLTRETYHQKSLWKRFVGWFGNLLTPVM